MREHPFRGRARGAVGPALAPGAVARCWRSRSRPPSWPSRSWGRSAAPSSDPQGGARARSLGPRSSTSRRACLGPSRPTPRAATRPSNLRPGSYRVEVVTTSFKKAERTGVVLRASGTALVDVKLELGSVTETVTVSAEAMNNITLESQAIARGLDEQQLRDLPRNSRDIQYFLLLNPNVVGGSGRHPVPGRPHLRRLLHPGRPGLDERDLRHGRQLRPRPRRDLRDAGALELLQRRVRRPRRGRGHDQARAATTTAGTAFYDFNSDSLNALTYNQKLAGAERGEPNSDTHQHRWGASFGGPAQVSGKTFFHANYEGSNAQGDLRRRPGERPHRGHAQRRLLGHDHRRSGTR